MLTYKKLLENSLTPHHLINFLVNYLKGLNYREYKLGAKIIPGRYFFIHETLIVCIVIPDSPKHFRIVATHSDSPCLKLKPNPFFKQDSLNLISLKTYGGGLWHTFFDKPLTMAGALVTKEGKKIVTIPKCALIPSLAPHSAHEIYKDGFVYCKENHVKALLLEDSVIDLLNDSLSHDISLIDENFYESKDFIISGRQDNLSSTFCAIKSLLSIEKCNSICITAVFDHEEVGSSTNSGAKSIIFSKLIDELAKNFNMSDFHSKSFIISADAGHADHFNYPERADKLHPIKFNDGTILKVGRNYATDWFGSSIIQKLQKCQVSCVKNNVPCGSTIGSMLNSSLGMPCVDIGVPLLAMHSSSELVAKKDLENLIDLLVKFFSAIEIDI